MDELDGYQQAAVSTEERRVRVLAGAGSGKTRVLAARVRYLLDQGVPPEKILAVTFSRKAADELKERCSGEVDARTIHSLGYRLLGTLAGGRKVADDRMRKKILRRAMAETQSKLKFAEVLEALGRWKGDGCVTDTPVAYRTEVIRYEGLLRGQRLWDFDDLINVPIREMQQHPEKHAKFEGKWDHILIDEVQDTDMRQWQLFELLCAVDTNLYLVGDISQAVYSWRGAAPMELFGWVEQHLGPFIEYRLPRNYRSRPSVVRLANEVIRGKQGSVQLEPTRDEGVEVFHVQHPGSGEPLLVRGWIQGIGRPWSEIAVLARTNAKLAEYEALLAAAEIPYAVAGGFSFFERMEIQDVLAYLRAIRSVELGEPDVEALERIYCKPTRYLGKAWLAELGKLGGWQAWMDGDGRLDFSKRYMRDRSEEFHVALVDGKGYGAREQCEYVIDGPLRYRKWLMGEELDMADELRDENLNALLEQADGKTVDGLLELAGRCVVKARMGKENEGGYAVATRPDRVALSTVHKAKGLEWDSVAVVGLDHDVWPHKKATDLEEERRILYVAMTRARERLLVSTRIPSAFYREVVRHAEATGVSVTWRGQSPPPHGGDADGADHDAAWRGGSPGRGVGDSEPSHRL